MKFKLKFTTIPGGWVGGWVLDFTKLMLSQLSGNPDHIACATFGKVLKYVKIETFGNEKCYETICIF